MSEPLIISALTLIFLVMSSMLGVLIKVVSQWARTEERLTDLTQDVKDLNTSTNQRITWLEQNLWSRRR